MKKYGIWMVFQWPRIQGGQFKSKSVLARLALENSAKQVKVS